MHISLNFLLLGISLLLLVKASDKLVDNATILANKIGISH
ncbi:sodium:calcium antiporter, partial [Candidatus Woesearchaeota archaeon]|nr:sodium:calcium antiporter [Candidatus Woesearchaeota archaeon]